MKLWGGPGVFSQSWRATNCAIPGYSIFLHDTMRRRKKQVFRVCGRRCGQARFFGSFSTGEFPPQATVPRASGLSLSGEWIGRLSSQSKRATNCATPGYEFFQLWSNMWSTPIFDQLPARGKVLPSLLSQGFPGFPRAAARTCASRSQSKRATNCATPGYEVFQLWSNMWSTPIFDHQLC